ncbi:MAG: hypothetical protein M3N10_00115 [Actinomycetota bacterium]|nr:hypothetical protein [Actinomycetota bacterium]
MKRLYFVLILLALTVSGCSGLGQPQLTVDEAMEAFREAGLECEAPEFVAKSDGSPLPKTFEEAQRCVVPSVDADHGIRVFAFDSEEDLQMVKDYYEGFSGMFGSYVYVRDNLLFQTSVSMPEELAEQYQQVFETFEP